MKLSMIAVFTLLVSLSYVTEVSSEGLAEIIKNTDVRGKTQTDNHLGVSVNNSQSNSTANSSKQTVEDNSGQDNLEAIASAKKQMTMEEVIHGFFDPKSKCRILYLYKGGDVLAPESAFLNALANSDQHTDSDRMRRQADRLRTELSLLRCAEADRVFLPFKLVLNSYRIEIQKENIKSFNDGYKKIVPVVFVPNDKSEDPISATFVMRNTNLWGWVIDLDASTHPNFSHQK